MKSLKLGLILSSLFLLPSCDREKTTSDNVPAVPWENLLDCSDLNELWQGAVNRQGAPAKEVGSRWVLADDVLSLDNTREGRGGSIETKKTYKNFELQFEFRIQRNCNSGVKYRLKNSTGLEYQIIDDEYYVKDNKIPSHRTAGLYEIKGPPEDRHLNPAGTWNTARILADGNTIEHWLNGVKVVSITFKSPEWEERFAKSKYFRNGIMDFATHKGPIHLQDHSDTIIEFRDILIREL